MTLVLGTPPPEFFKKLQPSVSVCVCVCVCMYVCMYVCEGLFQMWVLGNQIVVQSTWYGSQVCMFLVSFQYLVWVSSHLYCVFIIILLCIIQTAWYGSQVRMYCESQPRHPGKTWPELFPDDIFPNDSPEDRLKSE